jgi:hypothetical protein
MQTTIRSDQFDREYRWNGAHTVNIYQNGEEVDVFSFGDFAKNNETYENFRDAVERHEADWTKDNETGE